MTQGTIFNLVVIFSGKELKEDDYVCVCVITKSLCCILEPKYCKSTILQ